MMPTGTPTGGMIHGVQLEATPRWVVAQLSVPHRTRSWAVVGGGTQVVTRIVWHQVDNTELPLDVDPELLLRERMATRGLAGSVGMLTSRDLRFVHRADAAHDGVQATAVVTAGFSNALAVGDSPVAPQGGAGTINVLCRTSCPLSEQAELEALSLVAEARTAAVLEGEFRSIRSGRTATGTGTDCIVLAAPLLDANEEPRYQAGKHTALGAAIGEAVRNASREAVRTWIRARAQGLIAPPAG